MKCHAAAYLLLHPLFACIHTQEKKNHSFLANEALLLSLFEKRLLQWRGERERRRGALEDKRGGTITITAEVEILLDRPVKQYSVINTFDLQNAEAIMNSVKEPKDHSRC